MLNLTRPRFFMPIHGEYRHLMVHSKLARKTGIPEERCLLATNGDVVSFYSDTAAIVEKVESGRVFVDGKGVGDVGNVVLRDRKHLSEDGMVVVIIGMNKTNGGIIYGPDIVSRGFVFEDESQEYLETARCIVVEAREGVERGDALRLRGGQHHRAPGAAEILQEDHRAAAGDPAGDHGDVASTTSSRKLFCRGFPGKTQKGAEKISAPF